MITTIIALPIDVLVVIFEPLSILTLAALSQTCKHLYFAVSTIMKLPEANDPNSRFIGQPVRLGIAFVSESPLFTKH